MEPVEIDIVLNQNVSQEADKASQGVSGISQASQEATRALEAQVQRQLQVLSKLNKSLDDLEKRTVKDTTQMDVTQVDATMQRIDNLRGMIADTRNDLVSMRVDAEKINAVVAQMAEQYAVVQAAIQRMKEEGKTTSPLMSNMKEEQQVLTDAIGRVGAQTDELKAKMSGLGVATKEEFDQARRAVKQQSEEVKNLKAEILQMEKEIKSQPPGRARDGMEKNLEGVRQQYAGAVVDLDRMKIKQDELQISSRRLTEQMEGLRDKMIKLRLEGGKNTKEYKELEELYRRLSSEAAGVRFDARDDGNIQGVVQGVSGLAGVLTAGTGVMGLFNSKTEQMERLQARLQSMIAITIGLQEANNLVNRQGAFQTQILSKANLAYASAVSYLNTQLGLSVVASRALVASGIGAIIAAVGLAAVAYSDWNKRQKESKDLQEKMTKVALESQKSIQEQVTKVQSLERILKDSNAANIDRSNALLELKGIMPGYNAMLSSEGDLIADNTGALNRYIDKIKSAAKAKIAADNAVKAEQTLSDFVSGLSKSEQDLLVKGDNGLLSSERMFAYNTLSAQRKGLKDEVDKWNKILDDAQSTGVDKVEQGTKAYWETVQKNAQASIEAMKDTQKGSKAWNDAVTAYNNATKRLKTFDIKGTHKTEETQKEKQEKADATLSKMSLDYDTKIEAARAAAIKKGRDQRLADARADFQRANNQLEKDLIAIDELEKITGRPATQQREKNKELSTAVEVKYNAEIDTINAASSKALDDIFRSVNAAFRSELDRSIADINSYYDDVITKATQEGATLEQLSYLRLAQTKEIEQAQRDEKIKTIDFDAEVATMQMQIADKLYLFEADRQAALINIQRDAARKRLDVMREQYAASPTPDLARDIELAELQLQLMGKTLEDLNTSKLAEISALAQSIAKLGQSLKGASGALGQVGEMLSAAASGADDVLAVFEKGASTVDLVSAGVSGLATLFAMVSEQTKANKEAQDEYTAAILESEQAARMAGIAAQAYEQRNMFGVENPYAKAIASMREYTTAMGMLRQAAIDLEAGKVQVGTTKDVSGSNIMTGAGAGAAVGGAIGSIVPFIGTAIGAAIGGLIGAGVGALTKKTVPVFESLSKKYGQIFDPDTFAINPKILNDYARLDDATKQLVDNWQEIQDAALEAQEQMQDTLTQLSGDIGQQLSDSLVDAFRNGDVYDAVDSFHDKITSTIEDIIAQLVFVAAFGDIFDELGERFIASFDPGGDQSIVDDMMWFDKEYQNRLAAYEQAMKDAQQAGKDMGYDFFTPTSSRTGTQGAISSASQESISELSGGVLALRSAVADIRNMQRDELEIHRAAFAVFVRISDNTEYCRYLERMNSSVEELLLSIDEIRSRGIKTIL